MRTIPRLFFFLFVTALTTISVRATSTTGSFSANETDTLQVSFKVKGTASCKSAIEALAMSKSGVLTADWNSSTEQIAITYLPATAALTDIYATIALGGYDTEELRAKTAAYDALSAACKYTREPDSE